MIGQEPIESLQHCDWREPIELLHCTIKALQEKKLHTEVILYSMSGAKLTKDQRVTIVMLYAETRNASETVRQFKVKYPGLGTLSPSTVLRTVKRFYDTGGTDDRKRSGRRRSGRSPVNIQAIDRKINDDPELSLRRISCATDIPYSTVRTIVRKDLKMKAYRSRMVQELKEGDHEKRVEWAEEWLEKVEYNNEYEENILWTDEAIFKLNGKVNIHNAITWAKTNPRKTVDRAYKKEGIMVWCGLLNDEIIGPYFFEQGTVTGKSYLGMLKRLWPYLQSSLDEDKIEEIIFQQDGAPSHYFHEVTEWLNNTFEDRWMGRGGPIPWPARSPDLTPLDFWLWGYLKGIVYAQSPKTIPDLKTSHIRCHQ